MRQTRVVFVFLSLFVTIGLFAQAPLPPPPQPGAPNQKATISGVVARVTTVDPINRATVTLTRVTPPANPLDPQGQGTGAGPNAAGARGAAPQGRQPAQQQGQLQIQAQPVATTVLTDEQGKFQFKDLDPGNYRLTAARNGFARQEYGSRSLNRPGTVINLRAGQQMNDVSFRLTPAATISGRVQDSNGEPLVGVTVQALRSTFDATGKRTLQTTSSGRTNDLGEYRLYWINPGRYFVSANSAKSAIDVITSQSSQAATAGASPEQAQAAALASSMFGPAGNPNEVVDTSYAMTFYPGTTDPVRAVAVDLQPGNEIRSIDFILAKPPRVKISGRIIDSDTGRPPQGATVSVTPRDTTGATTSSPLDVLIGMDPSAARYNPMTGEFTLNNVAAGAYWLQVIAPSQATIQAAGGPNANPNNIDPAAALNILASINTARMLLDVGANDVENILLAVTSGVSISGRIRLDGTPASGNGLAGVTVGLQGTGAINILSLLAGGGQRPSADGTFSIPRITSGEYRLQVNGLGNAMYIKEAHLESQDVLQPGFTIDPPVNTTLDITLGSNPGQVIGILTDATSRPISGVQVVLVPEQSRNRQDLYKTANSDQEGRFTLRGVTPGDYRLFAWEDIEPFSYFDTTILQQYQSQGKAVRVAEGGTANADVKIIPAAGQ